MAAFVAAAPPPSRVATQAATVCGARPRAAAAVGVPPPTARAVATMKAPRSGGGGGGGGDDDTIDYAEPLSVLADDMCDVTGVNCGPDGSPPAGASRVVPPRAAPTATEGRMPPLVNYAGKESVLQNEAHETSG